MIYNRCARGGGLLLATYKLFYSRSVFNAWRTHAVCKYACFSAAVDPFSRSFQIHLKSGTDRRSVQDPSRAPSRPRALGGAIGQFRGRRCEVSAPRLPAQLPRRAGRGRGRGSPIALSGAVATCIETEKAQYVRSIIFLTCGIGFADAAAAEPLLTLPGFIWFGQPGSPPPGAPLLQPSTWKSSPGQL